MPRKRTRARKKPPTTQAETPVEPAETSGEQPSARAIPLRRRLIYLAVPPIAFILLLLLIELIARLALEPVSSLETFVRVAYPDLVGEKEGARAFEGDPLLAWRFKPNLKDQYWDYTTFSTNEAGLRHDGPVRRKPRDGFRVLCVGDSVTWGYRVPVSFPQAPLRFNRNHRPYPRLLEAKLRAMLAGRAVDVVTLAVPGYTSHQGLAWLRRDIDRYDPDLVIICFGWNDTDVRAAPDSETLPMGWLARMRRRLLGASRAMVAASRWIEDRRAAGKAATPPTSVPRISEAQYVENFRHMTDLVRRRGARPIVIAPIYRDAVTNRAHARRIAAHRRALADAMRDQGTPYLEIPELTEAAHPDNAGLFGELIHPNHVGHRLMTTRLLELMRDLKLLPVQDSGKEG